MKKILLLLLIFVSGCTGVDAQQFDYGKIAPHPRLLLPAGGTSEASIKYKDEAELLDKADDVDKVYVEKVLPEKMKYNLESIRKFSFIHDIGTMIKTVFAVIR